MDEQVAKRAKAYEMYIGGMSYSKIGKAFGLDKERVRHMITKHLRDARPQGSIGQTKLDTL